MTLVPMTGLVGGVAKREERDPRGAAMLVQLGLFEALTDQIEAVREPMAEAVLANVEKANARARSVLLRKSAAGEDVPLEYAEALSNVEKGLMGWVLSQFNRDHPRDDRGRFIRRKLGRNVNPNMDQTHRFKQHVMEAAQYRDRLKSSGIIDDDTTINVGMSRVDDQGRASDTIDRHQMKARELDAFLAASGDLLPREVGVARRDVKRMTPQQLAAVDLAALATQSSVPSAAAMTRGIFNDSGHVRSGDERAREWQRGTEGTDRQSYRRIKMTGETLSAVSAPGSALSAVGGLAQLAGEIGPEAEKILGPGIRRTAYRYRGTERRPDQEMWNAVGRATEYADMLADPKLRERGKERIYTMARTRGGGDLAAVVAANHAGDDDPATEDQRDLSVRGGAAVASLLGIGRKGGSRLPDMQLAELSLASGEMPPSEGVIIDARGRVVTQAVGYNGDHYLPFDLRNLGALHGGQYVRTRATGGPTTEDIYTALVTGTRQLQVVSNSGVFTVEFDPDLRGARRFNDKVARMVERYGSMLAAIHSPDPDRPLLENDLSPEEFADIREEAARAARGDQEKFKQNYRTLVARRRAEAEQTNTSLEEREQAAYNQAKTLVDNELRQTREGASSQQRAKLIESAAREILANQDPGVRRLRLNGKGYERALKALKQEFPYYIRQATFESLPEWLNSRNLPNTPEYRRNNRKDVGYVEQGQTNTARTRTGGFRSARYVQTGRAARQEARTAGTQQQEATQTAQTAAQATAGQRVLQPTGQQQSAPAKPDPKAAIQRQMASAGTPLIGYIHAVPPVGLPDKNDTDDDVMAESPPAAYAHRIASKMLSASEPGEEGAALASWLLNANSRQRATFVKGVEDFAKSPDLEPNGVDPDQVRRQFAKLNEAIELVDPFTPASGQGPVWQTRPLGRKPVDTGDRPQDMLADDDEWDAYLTQAQIDDPHFVDEVNVIAGNSDPAKYVKTLHDAWDARKDDDVAQNDLELAQRAWSFVHAREVSRKLRGLVGGGAGPKAPAAESVETGKALGYAPPAQDFLLDLRGTIDRLLAQ